ncbi:MAG: beta-lactamase family protein [Solirubrobacteraceae bacterium]|nr:beta-lactamase family protein [Solirubrobacteraceae bacterium]
MTVDGTAPAPPREKGSDAAPLRAAARACLLGLALLLPCAPDLLAAPDEARYGADRAVGSFTALDRLFPTRAVRAGGEVRELPRHPAPPDWPFVQAYLDAHPATGLLVVKDGRVLVERYQYGRQPDHRFTSFSMAKTLVAMAVGVAVAEGRIASIDDPVDRYEPALAASAWRGVPLRHVLTMASGVRFDETYDRADTDIARLSRAWTRQEGTLLERLAAIGAREAAPGERFAYASVETQVLGQVLARATGTPLADYVSERIWRPMGAEADAAWVLDAGGTEAAYCCLSARLRDWARLGLLLLEGGRRDGGTIVPADWVEAATTVRAADRHLQPRRATPYFGYGYQTWILPDGLGFALLGVRGQAVFVSPRERLVIAQTAVWPSPRDASLAAQRDRFWREVVAAAARL